MDSDKLGQASQSNQEISKNILGNILFESNADRISYNVSNPENIIEDPQNQIGISLSRSILESSSLFNIQKSSYINVVNHIVKSGEKKGILYFTDFENGEILPDFVEVLSKKKIPNLISNPLGYDQLMNNRAALHFINQCDSNFNPQDFNMSKKNDVIDLIRILLKKYILTKEYIYKMKEDCNNILYLYKKNTNNFNIDWKDGINFTILLSFITKNDINFNSTTISNIEDLRILFAKANCPFIMEDDSLFENTDEIIIQYQVKLILDEVQNRKLQIQNRPLNNEIKNLEKTEKLKDSNPLLRVLNIVGSQLDIQYNSLDDVCNCVTFYRLVKYLMRVSAIPGVNEENLSDETNISTILNFLREKNYSFRYLSFGFDNQSKRIENIKLLVTTLLNEYFIKDNKEKMIEIASQLFGQQIKIEDFRHIFLFGNGFYRILGRKNYLYKNYYDEDSLVALFQEKNVPFILDEDSLLNINNDYIFFQLQLIFDNLISPCSSSKDQTNKLLESELVTKQFDEIIENRPAKCFLEFLDQNDSNNRELDKDTLNFFFNSIEMSKKSLSTSNKNSDSFLLDQNKVTVEDSQLIDTPQDMIEQAAKNDDDSESQLSNNTITYESSTNETEDFKNKISKELENAFNNVIDFYQTSGISDRGNYIDQIDDDDDSLDEDQSLKSFKIFEYKSNEWVYNESIWTDFLSNFHISSTDSLYLILLPPSCTKDADVENDPAYRLVSSISCNNKIEGTITNGLYVEIFYCGKIDELNQQFHLSVIPNHNQCLALIQLRYPSSFKDNICIANMQAALTLQANYILTVFPTMNINESAHFINAAMNQVKESFYLKSDFIQLTFLLNFYPPNIDSSAKNIFTKQISLNKLYRELVSIFKADIFKKISNLYQSVITNFQWIDLNNHNACKRLIETIIIFCQNHTNDLSKIDNFTNFWKKISKINSKHNQKQINEFMDEILNDFNQHNSTSIFNYYPRNDCEKIVFNEKIWIDFLEQNKINNKDLPLYLITFINSNSDKVKFVSEAFSNKVSTKSINFCDFQVQISYHGCIKDIISKHGDKRHLVIINIIAPNNNRNAVNKIYFEAAVSLISNIVITIADPEQYNVQLSNHKRLINVLKSSSNLPQLNEQKHYFLFLDQIQKDNKIDTNNLSDISIHVYDNINNSNSDKRKIFIKYILEDSDFQKKISFFNNYFKNIEIKSIKYFNVLLFQYITITDKNEYIINRNDKNNLFSQMTFFIKNKKQLILSNDKVSKSNNIDFYLCPIIVNNRNNKNLYPLLLNIRKEFNNYYTKFINESFIKDIFSNGKSVNFYYFTKDKKKMSISEFVENYIKNTVTVIDENFVDIMKKACIELIKDYIFDFVIEKCKTQNLPDDSAFSIYKVLLGLFADKLNNIMIDIDKYYQKTKDFKQKVIKIDKEQLEQESMKFVLTMREVTKETTVLIECDADLPSQIPQDH